MKRILFISTLLLSAPLIAGETSWTEVGDSVKETSGTAWDATKDSSKKTWDKTREGSSEAWQATKKESKKAWKKTKDAIAD